MDPTLVNYTEPLILVVDDYDDAREMYLDFFRLAGFRVAGARDGLEAVARARELIPDVIVMDLSLPLLDGWEATRQIRKNDQTQTIPVVALSGYSTPSLAAQAERVGCNAYLIKPCPPDELLTAVRAILARR